MMAGEAITRIFGKGVYVQGNDIDTDRIIPARFLKCVTFDELGPSLFHDERFTESGESKNHILDAPEHQGAEILISDDNFGCGSSREHAPQAIQKFGLKAVVAGSFAEIFHGNCTTLGIPCVTVADQDRKELAQVIQNDPGAELAIDLEKMEITCANKVFQMSMKKSAREGFLAATYDPLNELLDATEEIREAATRLGYA